MLNWAIGVEEFLQTSSVQNIATTRPNIGDIRFNKKGRTDIVIHMPTLLSFHWRHWGRIKILMQLFKFNEDFIGCICC